MLERVARAKGWAACRRRDRMGARNERQEGKKGVGISSKYTGKSLTGKLKCCR
jgi:hypothetical protein